MDKTACVLLNVLKKEHMKNNVRAVITALMFTLTACGGGGDNAAVIIPPIMNPLAILLTGVNITISVSSGDFLVSFSSAGSFTMSGSNNNVFFTANQNGGVMSISGNNNTVVLRSGDTASSLTITGSGNTIYIPLGSAITVSGAGANSNTVKIYP
ncbi:MAG TPA: hypothetical protein VIF82_09065 [Burkholderiaceae bacterium]|jgi:hypothetical protein